MLTGMIIAAMTGALLGSPVSPQAQTCNAAIAYVQHPTPDGLSKTVADATVLGKSLLARPVKRSYLSADVLDMLATVYSPSVNAPKYVKRDVKYIARDCLG